MDTMTLQRFRELADAWGGTLSRWPADQRVMAERLLERGDGQAARGILQSARELDAALAAVPAPPSLALQERILASAPHAATTPAAAAHGGDRNAAGADGHDGIDTTAVRGDAVTRGTEAERGSAVAAMGRSRRDTGTRSRGRGRRRGGIAAGLWRELGGMRIAGPALAAAMVLGVVLADARIEAPEQAAEDELLAAALLVDADYEDFAL